MTSEDIPGVDTTTAAIETSHLRKEFNGKPAVADLSLKVKRGEVFGFLGPNGAGKTTSVKMLLGLITPTSGRGNLLGAQLGDVQARSKVGFLPEHFRFHDWLTATEFLTLHGNLYQMPDARLATVVSELLDLVNLTPHRDKKLSAFSKGMLQRIGLAQALLNKPDLVILDEPTSGLDPVGRRLVRDIIHDLKSKGTTVFLNSHFLSEVEITCDRVAFIKDGIVIRTSKLSSLVEGEITLEIRARNLTPNILAGLSQWGQAVRAVGEQHVTMKLYHEDDLPVINRYLVEKIVDVYSINPKKISLEDLFLKVVGDSSEQG
jgi:ABC-2 type transport system ATP-binding protein